MLYPCLRETNSTLLPINLDNNCKLKVRSNINLFAPASVQNNTYFALECNTERKVIFVTDSAQKFIAEKFFCRFLFIKTKLIVF